MCGIVGYVGTKPAWPIILQGLERLEYRGYDSAGVAISDEDGDLQFRKTVGKVVGLTADPLVEIPQGYAGLGHTRWATHGDASDANCHPHTGCYQDLAIVHNGIVENYLELKQYLLDGGHHFTSETDTEVIAHLVEEGLNQGLPLEDAFGRMGVLLRGSQAVAVMKQGDAAKICAMRLGHAGGILVAHRDGETIVASDLPAILPMFRLDMPTGDVGFLDSGEMAVITPGGVSYQDLQGLPLHKELRRVNSKDVIVDKGGHRHFMLKEIMEQPQAVASAMRGRVDFSQGRVMLPEVPYSLGEIRGLSRVMLIGCGTSLHAAQIGRFLMERLAGLPAEFESASEFRYRGAPIDPNTLYVSVAQSGETADTVAAMQEIRDGGGRMLTICNVSGTQTTRLADATLYMHCGLEIGVASTKTFIASLTILNLLAVYLGQARGFLSPGDTRVLVDELARCPALIGSLLSDVSRYQELALRFNSYRNFMFLGRGISYPVVSEGALKLKEITYIHAEGYPAGEMKHGPIALVDEKMATLVLAPDDSLFEKMLSNVKEVRARHGVILGIATEGDDRLGGEVDEVLYIPPVSEHLTPLLATIPMQLLAYEIAVLRGCDVDQPRNLAKSVTVE